MKRDFREGDWFAVPLGGARFVAGIVASGSRNALSGYFFACNGGAFPDARDLADRKPEQALWASRFFDEALHEQRWPVLRAQPHFHRSDWPTLKGDPLKPGIVETFSAAHIDGKPAVRARSVVFDVREPLGAAPFDRIATGASVRVQWRAPLGDASLARIAGAVSTYDDGSIRLYGEAITQAPIVAAWAGAKGIELDAELPASFDGLPHATVAVFDGVPARIAAILARSPLLRVLRVDARGGRFDVAGLEACATLERLDIANASCHGVAALNGLPSLRTLELRNAELDDPSSLMQIAGLECLRLSEIAALRTLEPVRGHERLRVLAIDGLTHVDDVRVLATLPNLESLTLTGMWQFHPDDVAFLADIPTLERLKIDIGGRRKNVEIYRRRPFAYPRPF